MKQFEEFVKNARTITVESDDTTIVIRETLGFDLLDAPYLRGALSGMLQTKQGAKDHDDLGEITRGRIIEFVALFPKIVSAEGSFALTLPDHSSREEILPIYWAWLCWPASLMRAVTKGQEDVNKPVSSPKAKKSE